MAFTLDQLSVLDAIERGGSFAAAARRLHRSTPAISYAVKALEESLGLTLFDRSGHRARLSPAGALVLGEARALIERARGLSRLSEQLSEGWEPRLEIVLDGILPMPPIVAALRRFSELRTPTRIQLMVEHLSGVPQRFERDRADLMIALDFRPDPGLVAQPLPPIEMRLLAVPDHALFAAPSVDRAVLAQHIELRVADSGQRLDGQTGRLSLGSPHVFQVSNFHSKREALLGGVGFGWLPLHLARADLDAGRLGAVPFVEGASATFVPHLVHRRGSPLGQGGRFFLGGLAAALADWASDL